MTIEEANIREEVLLICGCDVTRCMKCGKCSASCPAYDEFDIKPHQFASYIARGDMYELMQSKTIWNCLGCFACVERCPSDMRPGKLIDGVRQAAVRRRGGTHLQPEDIPSRIDPDTPQQLLMSVLRRERK